VRKQVIGMQEVARYSVESPLHNDAASVGRSLMCRIFVALFGRGETGRTSHSICIWSISNKGYHNARCVRPIIWF
jgi:hypothetical protein